MPVSARLAPPVIARVARAARVATLATLVMGLSAALSAAMLGGCGRKASEEDCALLLDRNVEVALRSMNVTDPAAIQKKKDEIRGEMKGDMKDCVGKRITDGMLGCVRKAETPAALDSCMR